MCLCRVDAEGRSRERGEERLRTSYEMKMDGEGWRRGWRRMEKRMDWV